SVRISRRRSRMRSRASLCAKCHQLSVSLTPYRSLTCVGASLATGWLSCISALLWQNRDIAGNDGDPEAVERNIFSNISNFPRRRGFIQLANNCSTCQLSEPVRTALTCRLNDQSRPLSSLPPHANEHEVARPRAAFLNQDLVARSDRLRDQLFGAERGCCAPFPVP